MLGPHDCTSSVWDELVFIPVIESPIVRKVESKKGFFCLAQLPHLHTYPHHFAMPKPISLLAKPIIIEKTYISSWLNFSNYILLK
jgi:hypothetical protein